MTTIANTLYRHELSPQFLRAAKKEPDGVLPSLLAATEYVRDNILMPATTHLGDIAVERKGTGGQRDSDAKTFSIITDKECEAMMETMLLIKYPDALIIGEERYGDSSPEEKRRVLKEALVTDRMVILTDSLDATRDFTSGGDGFGTLVSVLEGGKVTVAVAHRNTDYADPTKLGHTLTFEANDNVRRDGRLLTPLSERTFTSNPLLLRGYAGYEFVAPMRGKPVKRFPDLSNKFDSLSDLWTVNKLLNDLLTGEHHFGLIPPPTDLFDYTAGVAMIQAAGGTVKFLDGTPASFAEIVRRQDFDGGSAEAKSLHNTLVFAVSENVFDTVQKTVYEAAGMTPPVKKPRPDGPAFRNCE